MNKVQVEGPICPGCGLDGPFTVWVPASVRYCWTSGEWEQEEVEETDDKLPTYNVVCRRCGEEWREDAWD